MVANATGVANLYIRNKKLVKISPCQYLKNEYRLDIRPWCRSMALICGPETVVADPNHPLSPGYTVLRKQQLHHRVVPILCSP